MAEIKKIFVNGKDEVEFFKQLEKRSGETNTFRDRKSVV